MTTRADLAAACRHLAERGLSPGGSGSLSARDGDGLLVTATGSSCSRVRPEDLARAPLDDSAAPADGPRPTKELSLHRAVYRLRPDLAAVVHLHSHWAVAASCLDTPDAGPLATGPLPAVTPYQVMRLGRLPVVPYAPPGSAELAAGVAAVIGGSAVLLLANHGSVAAAPTLDQAVDLAEELEAAARLTFTLAQTRHRRLGADEVAELRGPR